MRPTMQVCLASGAAAVALTSAGFAQDTAATNNELLDRLNAAETRIAELEAENTDNWLTEQRAEEIRGLVQDVLADADTRSSLLQSGMTAGYDNGAVISSADGNWLLRTNIVMQQRFVYNSLRSDVQDETRWGFENTRTKFILTGHVVNPDWFYRVDINVGVGSDEETQSGDRTGTLNAYLGYDYGNGMKVYFGTFKAPLLREELIETQYQQAVERSILNYTYSGGYTDGIMIEYATDQFRVWGSFNDGVFQGQTNALAADTEWALTGRAEVKFSGTWDQFDDFTSPPGSEQGILAGVGLHWQIGEFGTTTGPLTPPAGVADNEWEVLLITADGQLEMSGWNVYGAFVYQHIDVNVSGVDDADQFGFLIQGGFYIADDWEPYVRWEWADFDTSGVDDLNLITAGINKYFAGHNAKWTTDFGYAFNALDLGAVTTLVSIPNGITNWRADETDKDGQFVLRTQFKIYF